MLIWKILGGAFGYVFEYRSQLGKALLVPFLVMAGLGLYEPDSESVNWPIVIAALLAQILLYTVIAITTHRIILMGPSSIPEWGLYMPSKREIRFILYSIGIGLAMIPLGFLLFIPVIGTPVAIVAIAYVMGRLSLVFPAIATDQGWTFSDSWKATESHQILMMIVAFVFPALMGIPEDLLSYLPYSTVMVNIVSAITLVFIVAALSVAFKVITEETNER